MVETTPSGVTARMRLKGLLPLPSATIMVPSAATAMPLGKTKPALVP